MEGAQRAATTQHESCAAESMARFPQEVELVLQGHVRAIILCDSLQMLLDLLDVFPDGLWHCGKVLMELTAGPKHDVSASSMILGLAQRTAHALPSDCLPLLRIFLPLLEDMGHCCGVQHRPMNTFM